MNNSADTTSAAEDLAYIRRIMEETRRAVATRGDGFIIWGIVVLLGLLGNYLFIRLGPPPGWAWAALWGPLTLIGWLFTMLCVRRDTKRVSTPTGRTLGAVWVACTIAGLVLCFAGVPLGVIIPAAIGPVISAVVGIGVFLTGCLMGTGWVRNLAFGWWACTVAQFFWHGSVQLLIYAIALLLLYIVPGIILNLQARRTAARQ